MKQFAKLLNDLADEKVSYFDLDGYKEYFHKETYLKQPPEMESKVQLRFLAMMLEKEGDKEVASRQPYEENGMLYFPTSYGYISFKKKDDKK